MADDERSDDDDFEWEDGKDEGTEPGGWERKPSDEEDRRHDDDSEPLAEPSDDDDDDLAEREAGDKSAGDDEGFDRPEPPDEEEVGEFGGRLEERAEPLLRGPEFRTPAGPLPTRSLLGIGIFIVVWCAVFFGLWALMGGIGILLGIFLGTAAGFFAVKFVAGNVE